MPTYLAVLNAMKAGVQGVTAKAAIKSIEGWQAKLAGVEVSGVEAVRGDLDALKQQLQKDEIDGNAVRELVAKLGRETMAIAGKLDGEDAGKIGAIGKALSAGGKTGSSKA